MPADNVTPFRRPAKRAVAPQQQGGWGLKTHRGRAVLSQALTLAAFLCNFFLAGPWSLIGTGVGVAAAVVAFSNRGQGMPWAATHHEHALRTLIIGYSVWVLGGALTYVSPFLGLATLLAHIVVAIWAGLRSALGLGLALMRRAIPNPKGLLI